MNLKLILLSDGSYIITWIYELPIEPKAFLANPLKVVKSGKGIALKKFPEHSDQEIILLFSNSICTIVEPDSNVKSKYRLVYPDEPDIDLPKFDDDESKQLLNEESPQILQ